MSGHSKWSQIKRQKGVADTFRGQIFTKLAREITVAARSGGADPTANFRLRLAIQKARDSNMPHENTERAIKRGTGELSAAALEELVYEGYGPGGVAVLVEGTTDNHNRFVADVRNILTRAGGSLGEAGSVSWLFEQRGLVVLEPGKIDEDELLLAAAEAGADDVKYDKRAVDVYTSPDGLESVRRAMEERHYKVVSAEVAMFAKSTIPIDAKVTHQILRLMEKLEELDDVQRVFTNADYSEEGLDTYGRQ